MRSLVINKNNLISIISFLTIVSSFYLFENQIISGFGAVCAIAVLSLCALMLIANIHKFSFDFTLGVLFFILVFLIAQIFYYKRMGALYSIAQILGFMILIVVLEKAQISSQKLNSWKKYIRFVYYLVMMIYTVAFFTNNVTMLEDMISPTILKILFPLSWFSIKRKAKTTPIEIGIFVVFHFLLGERTAAICMVVVLLFQCILKRMNSKVSNIFFWCVFMGAVSFPFAYMWLYEQPIGKRLNLYVYNQTGEQFFSGRNRIWGVIIDRVSDEKIFGLGFGNTFLADHGINMSTHNLYMYLYLNGGILLIALFALFMYSIWRNIKHSTKSEHSVIVGKAYILGLFIFLDMELFLLANNIVISLMWWITIAFIQIASRNDKSILQQKMLLGE